MRDSVLSNDWALVGVVVPAWIEALRSAHRVYIQTIDPDHIIGAHIYIHTCTYLYTHIYTHVHIYIYIYIYTCVWGASLPAAAPHCPHLGTSGLGAGWLAGRLAGWLACLLSQLDVSARQPRVRGPGLERIEDCAEVHHQISRLFTSHLHNIRHSF